LAGKKHIATKSKKDDPLTIGTDVELIKENEVKPIDITTQNKMQCKDGIDYWSLLEL
jgi:hypothetical protein